MFNDPDTRLHTSLSPLNFSASSEIPLKNNLVKDANASNPSYLVSNNSGDSLDRRMDPYCARPPPHLIYQSNAYLRGGGIPPPLGLVMYPPGPMYGQQPYAGGGYGQTPGYPMPNAPSQTVVHQAHGSSSFRKHAWTYFTNQKVQVNITGYGWLVGSVVALVNLANAVTGSGVRVRYFKVRDREEEDEFPNDPEYIRPLQQ